MLGRLISPSLARRSVVNAYTIRRPALVLSLRAYSSGTEEEKRIYEKLSKAFNTTDLRVQDVSGGCGSMYAIDVTSDKFNTLTTIKQHQMVNEVLKEDIPKWHGLQLRTKKNKTK
ncbi:Altered inheritance of mitochondria protein 1 [Nakaseomyces glabratus]|nr:Altered inheritance of mitochondria protein 1 [Nakaseomyces glabratus]KTB26450.1 Altered inheritance of mitochondria protein 1 [Nakaseomyces glabratus]